MKELECDKILTLCTSHITVHDNDVLAEGMKGSGKSPSDPILRAQYEDLCSYIGWDDIEQGWLIHLPFHLAHSFSYEQKDRMLNQAGMSLAFVEILDRALRQGCRYIRFDADEDIYPELPTFEW